MRRPMTLLVEVLKEKRLSPTITNHQVNGKTTLRWHVDDDDDRYIELTDSLRSPTFVLHRRDKMDAVIIVAKDIPTTVDWINAQLKILLDIPR